jgi:hypothetical protein
MAESGLPRGLTKQTQFSSTMIYPDRLPIPPSSASIVQMGGPVHPLQLLATCSGIALTDNEAIGGDAAL